MGILWTKSVFVERLEEVLGLRPKTIKRERLVLGLEARKGFGTSPSNPLRVKTSGRLVIQGGELKLGKVLSALFPGLKPHEISALVDRWQQFYLSRELSMVKTSSCLSEIYDMPHASSGPIASSCMRHKGFLYTAMDALPHARIAYIEKDGVLVARAILWDNVVTADGQQIRFMDRIYYANSYYLNIMIRWAQENGYWRKADQNHDPGEALISPAGEICELSIKTPFYNVLSNHCPYLDTFRYIDTDWHEAANDPDLLKGSYVLADCTDGRVSYGEDYYACEGCGRPVDCEDAIFVGEDPYCPACIDELFVWSECCEDYIPKDEALACDCCGDYAWSPSCGWLPETQRIVETGDGYYLCPRCAENASWCDHCNRPFYRTDLEEGPGGIWLCPDCLYYAKEQLEEIERAEEQLAEERLADGEGEEDGQDVVYEDIWEYYEEEA